MKPDKLYNEIIQAYWDFKDWVGGGEEKFQKLLDQHPLLTAISDVNVDEVKKSFKSAVINKYYLALALDLTLEMDVILKGQSLNSEPAVEIAGLLLEAKANPNDYASLRYTQELQKVVKPALIKEAIASYHDNNVIKVLLSKSTYQIDLTVFPYLKLALLDRKFACPVQAWHLFTAGAGLGKDLTLKLIKQVVCQNNAEIFIFLQGIYKFHVSQCRGPVVAKELEKLFPSVLVKIIQEFSDDLEKTTDQIAAEMSLESPEWKPLDQVDTLYAAVKNKKYPQGVLQKCTNSPNEEIKLDDLSLQPLMQFSALGEENGVRALLEAKADPTMSIDGSFAFTWAIRGNRNDETQPRYINTAMSIFSRLLEDSSNKQSKPLEIISKGFGQSCIIA